MQATPLPVYWAAVADLRGPGEGPQAGLTIALLHFLHCAQAVRPPLLLSSVTLRGQALNLQTVFS
jgi:hypothetical protein